MFEQRREFRVRKYLATVQRDEDLDARCIVVRNR
jgi:hypothetical protein